MAAILGMGVSFQPDLIQVQTWNDGPESHYIGNIWPEQNTDSIPGSNSPLPSDNAKRILTQK